MTVLPDPGLPLADEFPDASREQWQRLVEGVLTKAGTAVPGTPAEETLSTMLQDGIATRPLYTAQDSAADPGYPGFPPFTRAGRPEGTAGTGWDVRQRHARPDPKRTNEAVLADLENGVTSLWLLVGGTGMPVSGIPAALEGVYLDLAPVVLDAGPEFEAAAAELLRLYGTRGVPAHSALGNLGADPLGLAARTGQHSALDAQSAAAAALAARCDREYPGLRALTVDALPYHGAGASAAQELGCSIATGVAYLRALTAAGLTVDAACAQLEFRYAATADQFLTIAKLRAARRLWARVAQASGAASTAGAQRQHAVTSPLMMTRRDPWVNMLRTTVACVAAGVGGADTDTVLPCDDALGLPDDCARRIARNTSSITGVSEFPNLSEQSVEREAAPDPAGVAEGAGGGLPTVRRDDAFEALRARSDAHLAATGSRPRAFLAALGPAAAHTARASFAANLFQAGGIETVQDPVTVDAASVAEAFARSGATVACLCSSDKLYAEQAVDTAAALVSAGALRVFLAGRPGEQRETYLRAGVDEFVFAGGDAVAVLASVLDRMGVA
ncbi:methylmalonyl-CoA mutase family protein [Streptomyces sp. H39-C1]|uniref:methylmalonyl-CoA mutase family protein n=1 Tax=Streptomyces sp. H39-C1 TaxID=3004355 RepID=UPI0022B000BD|nr:methylmalonyl-CoA mutase family protein [Streptomyces sp. H39-C1]MCZ4102258.1 methylmalonyl-CoA mutase family protein [Streptomyces sp. H39-C1]